MKGMYIFTYDIIGTCSIAVEANSPEDAVKKIRYPDTEADLEEWDVDWPQNFETLSVKDMMKYCCDRPRKEKI